MKDLKTANQKGVFILDTGIAVEDNTWYSTYKEQNVFIKSETYKDQFNGNLIGGAWPGKVAFPDFWCPNTQDYWEQGLNHLRDLTSFDGIWLDLNEITSRCKNNEGECPVDTP